MRRILAMGIVLALSPPVFGQSLGDAARQARQKEKTSSKTQKKVITNDDIPESPVAAPAEHESAGKMDPDKSSALSPTPLSAREWRNALLTQMDRIESLQAQINKLSESIHFVTANAYVNGAEYNQHQVKKQQQVENLHKQLAEENKKLTDMQEAARKEGMGAAVYEP